MIYDIRTDFEIPFQIVTSTGTPVSPDAAPTYRIYGDSGLVASGTLDNLLTGVVSNVTNTNPAVITDTDHKLTSGTVVVITGVVGATGVNSQNLVATYVTADTFSVPVAAGGAYVSGGAWVVVGAYVVNCDSTVRAALEAGRAYACIIDYDVSSVHKTEILRFVAG